MPFASADDDGYCGFVENVHGHIARLGGVAFFCDHWLIDPTGKTAVRITNKHLIYSRRTYGRRVAELEKVRKGTVYGLLPHDPRFPAGVV